MCKFMKVSRSGYYEWLNNPGCNRDREDHELTNRIEIIFKEGRGNYGTRPIKKELSRQSIIVSRKRIARLMKDKGERFSTVSLQHSLSIYQSILEVL